MPANAQAQIEWRGDGEPPSPGEIPAWATWAQGEPDGTIAYGRSSEAEELRKGCRCRKPCTHGTLVPVLEVVQEIAADGAPGPIEIEVLGASLDVSRATLVYRALHEVLTAMEVDK
jgi:hypothetical protein